MANLDTKAKRASSVAISHYPMGPGHAFATNGLSTAERQVVGYGYFGILAAAAAAGVSGIRKLRGVGR